MRGSVEAVAVARDVASSSPSKPTPALDMMRYQRPNPDCLPLPNGVGGGSRKPLPPAAPAHRSSKDEAVATESSRLAAYLATTSLESKQRARAPPPPPSSAALSSSVALTRSPAREQGQHHHHPSDFPDPSSPSYLGGGGAIGSSAGEVLLQWGQNKRSRGRRDASSGAASPLRRQPGAKIPRRAPAPDKQMPPPSGPSYTRGSNLRVGSSSTVPARVGDAHHGRGSLPHHSRSAEDRAGGKLGRPEKQAAPVMGLMVPDQKPLQQQQNHHHQAAADQQQQLQASSSKPKLEVPRIYTTLSRKEKEEDFLAIKGTKLPVRPKKRPKTVEKAVNFICPGMWLTDVTRSRYEVREKKCPKKQKNRGLKGMESLDSDSD